MFEQDGEHAEMGRCRGNRAAARRRRRRRWVPTTRGICSIAPSFGAQPREIAEYATLSRSEAVERLLAGTVRSAKTPAPEGVRQPIVPPREFRQASPEQRRAFQAEEIRRGFELRTWWLEEMLATPSPLTERMTLFWHNHFVSSQQKVRFARLMYRPERAAPAPRARQLRRAAARGRARIRRW